MYLIYINYLNRNYKNNNLYEFIFSNNIKFELGDDWTIYPASSGEISPPEITYIKSVGLLETSDIELELVNTSDSFSMLDAVDGIIALGWEILQGDDEDDFEFDDDRLVFRFGDTLETVETKLIAKDLKLKKIK